MPWTKLGLVIDMAGALLLSIEAVKVRNLDAAVKRANARMQWFGTKAPGGRTTLPGFLILFGVPGAILVVGAALLVGLLRGQIADRGLPLRILAAVAAIGAVLAMLLGAFLVIFAALGAILRISEAAVKSIGVVDRRTADGTIGIIGAGLLILGFVLQFVGA
jgi:hypothetical protein